MKTQVRSRWSHAILVCKKCSKKQAKKGHGFGPDQKRLAAALKREIDGGKNRKSRIGVIEVGCLDVCPKNGVVVIDSRAPGAWRIIDPEGDFAAQIDALR
ncbi:MAG: (2Fe-2S) ferredoxin domain-containing protein [Pseudomonadota bacterium]